MPSLLSPCMAPRLHHPLQTFPMLSRFQAHHLSRIPRPPPRPQSLLQIDFSRFLITSVVTSVAPITFTHVIQADPTQGYLFPPQPCHSSLTAHTDPEFLKLTLPTVAGYLFSLHQDLPPDTHTGPRQAAVTRDTPAGPPPSGQPARSPPARGTHRAFS